MSNQFPQAEICVGRTVLFPEAPGENLPLSLPASGGSLRSLAGGRVSPVSAFMVPSPSPALSVSSPSLPPSSIKFTCGAFRAHPHI